MYHIDYHNDTKKDKSIHLGVLMIALRGCDSQTALSLLAQESDRSDLPSASIPFILSIVLRNRENRLLMI